MGRGKVVRKKSKCRKVRFRTEFDARKQGKAHNMRVYPCYICNGWHLTSQVQPKGKN